MVAEANLTRNLGAALSVDFSEQFGQRFIHYQNC